LKSDINLLFLYLLLVTACSGNNGEKLLWQEVENLPEPVSNNAVASVAVDENHFLYSFMGLSEGKTYKDIHSKAFKYNIKKNTWRSIENVPGDSGRLAATAATVNGKIYIFGGYTVAEDGSEVSVPDVYLLDPLNDDFSLISKMPVPVDDAVSLVYKDRYIYLISGWNNNDNVNNVQIFDTQNLQWQQATPFPGAPVFGHAGGIAGNKIVITDGVKIVEGEKEGERSFTMSTESWLGVIENNSITEINWKKMPEHPGYARYRMAAIGDGERIIFAGGSSNPYNYNGIGYNGEPAVPDSSIFAYSLKDSAWQELATAPVATMDHRSLIKTGDWYYLVGGMLNQQEVSNRVFRFKLE
jgi:N-acetylneuraminic acid mutarotase